MDEIEVFGVKVGKDVYETIQKGLRNKLRLEWNEDNKVDLAKRFGIEADSDSKFKDVLTEIQKQFVTMGEEVASLKKKAETTPEPNPGEGAITQADLDKMQSDFDQKLKDKDSEDEATRKLWADTQRVIMKAGSMGLDDEYQEMFETQLEKTVEVAHDSKGAVIYKNRETDEIIRIDDKHADAAGVAGFMKERLPKLFDVKISGAGTGGGQESGGKGSVDTKGMSSTEKIAAGVAARRAVTK